MKISSNARRIIFINDLDSPQIEQAIFILRDSYDLSPSDAVSEAQRIVNAYLDEIQNPLLFRKKEKKNTKLIFSFFLSAILVLAGAIISFLH